MIVFEWQGRVVVDCVGTFEMTSSENFDAYLQAVSVGTVTRKLANTSRPPTVEVAVDGEEWTIRTVTAFNTVELVFTSGVEFTEKTMDGRTSATTITVERDRLVQVQRVDGVEARTTWTFAPDGGLSMVHTAGDATATRAFRRL
ncbi:lipocalin/fatty-acid binding family protein [Streptomyces sp. NPDC093225]|uniref:lipocalin/fatty-acid binding family protein n=1 Tax=Streptomyces sp. NPDC093225 TaxID=3366034 RepID=UPI0037F5B386